MHHIKLKCKHPIYLSLGSSDSVVTISGLVPEVPDQVDYLSMLTSSAYSCGVVGIACIGFLLLIYLSCFKIFLCRIQGMVDRWVCLEEVGY